MPVDPPLLALELPLAPPVTRAPAAPVRRPRAPAVALLVVGVALVVGPIVGGLFSKAAAGKQMVDRFAPHLTDDALARYEGDLAVLRAGAAGIDTVYQQQAVTPGRFEGIDDYRQQASRIDRRATALLHDVEGAQPSYERVSKIGGFDRIPFLLVISGLVAVYGACVLLGGTRGRARAAAALVMVAAAALALYPFVSDLRSGTRAGHHMVRAFAPIMTAGEVRQLQDDFVVLVHADGELDTGFRQVPSSGPAGAAIATMVDRWPAVSSDLAGLVGTVDDDLGDFHSLQDLDHLTKGLGVSGLEAFPWVLVGLGVLSAGLAGAAWPRRAKEAG